MSGLILHHQLSIRTFSLYQNLCISSEIAENPSNTKDLTSTMHLPVCERRIFEFQNWLLGANQVTGIFFLMANHCDPTCDALANDFTKVFKENSVFYKFYMDYYSSTSIQSVVVRTVGAYPDKWVRSIQFYCDHPTNILCRLLPDTSPCIIYIYATSSQEKYLYHN